MPGVSIVSTVLNEAEDIPRLVESLLRLDPPAAEIVIVDGGSSDGTWEWLRDAGAKNPMLRAIRDETCSLKYTPGPVSKGRNVAIAAAATETIACVDAGCTYAPDWLERLTAPIARGETEYTLGGSCLALADATVWDWASAPFLGVRTNIEAPNKSCTARSMAFTKDLWRRIGGFPETVLLSEDTLFDIEARKVTAVKFPRARAMYHPRNTFRSACRQLGRYALGDGILGVRRNRLMRNAARCVLEVAALVTLHWSWIPLAVAALLEFYFAFQLDWLFLHAANPKTLAARAVYALCVPWIVTAWYLKGALTRANPTTNAQNAAGE
ncbi:MAG TPA: glycosyltransferase [Terracidiphilus sp.]|jgi:glycosyltransferase involved in cell wall biosynthesis|nr:glycosyltransferase [Terracidiphilus sp.]